MADDPNPDLGRANMVDAALAIARAAEETARALNGAAVVLMEVADFAKAEHDPFGSAREVKH